jgi:signal transduction histidine kinase
MHYDRQNEPTSLVGVNIDVTDSKRAAVTQEQLEEMIKINQLKDEFISLASHQLRTPATGVKQYLGMVLEGFVGEINDDQKVFLRTAYQSNERQLKIINDLLKTAQLDAERYALKKSLHAVDTLVADVVEEFQPIFDMRDQTVSFKLKGDESVGALIDYDEMRLAVTNLVENASKYSPRGSHLLVSVYKKGSDVYMAFKDEGVGIEPDKVDKIFDKFTRFDNALSDTVSGSGLGLYWVKRVVTMHKGKIIVKSKVNEGTTFIVRIPEDET